MTWLDSSDQKWNIYQRGGTSGPYEENKKEKRIFVIRVYASMPLQWRKSKGEEKQR